MATRVTIGAVEEVGQFMGMSPLPQSWIDDLEELALLLAAAVHDLDHPGTTNTFNVLS